MKRFFSISTLVLSVLVLPLAGCAPSPVYSTSTPEAPPSVTVSPTPAPPAPGANITTVLPSTEIPSLPPPSSAQVTSINGTILDVTGHIIAIQRNFNTIFTVYDSKEVPANAKPGMSVQVKGKSYAGLIYADDFKVTGGVPWPEPAELQQPTGRIDHIIFLIQENHTFDNYFGTYPGADGLPADVKLPVYDGGNPSVAPFHFKTPLNHDIDHSWQTTLKAINGGKMDAFVYAEKSKDTMGYYDETDLPNYWAYARNFVLYDHFFSSLAGPSLPNHLYTVAGQSGGLVKNLDTPPEGGFEYPEIAEEMEKANVSWKYYDGKADPKAFSLWNPMPGFATFMKNNELMTHLVHGSQFFRDLRRDSTDSILDRPEWR